MDNVARWSAGDRRDLFAAAAERQGINTAIVEKDFWVCWTLKRLFTLPQAPAGLIFKGGTSLSKVFNAIERFSEDVDLSFDRAALGFGGDHDPLNAPSNKKKRQALDDLTQFCRTVIRDRLLPQLIASFTETLQREPSDAWGLQLSPDDPDEQTLLFRYPQGSTPRAADEPAYIRPVVQLELGARGDAWPSREATVTPFAADHFPHLFTEASSRVVVLAAERTFWEKATLLHMWHHAPAEKPLRDRQSRHYYDLVRLFEKGIGPAAMADLELLQAVAKHKETFFPAAWAKYGEAKPGSLRLVPGEARRAELARDYQKMTEMIFGDAPSFEHILAVLAQIEDMVNTPGREQ